MDRIHHARDLHHRLRDLDESVAVREKLVPRGACDGQVIDFGVGAVDDRSALPFAVVPH